MSPSEETLVYIKNAAVTASHQKRDHKHNGETCHPHNVEVLWHGRGGTVICHCCGIETPFDSQRDADKLVQTHAQETK
jgi:hypothetical protein